MGVLVYILGRSGTGKSYSIRNFKKGEIGVVNVQGKILPFKGSGALDIENTDDSGDIVKHIERMAKKYKTIVVDDFQYVMANEFMRRATERGYDKFTEIARHAWDIANKVRELPQDVIVYVMCHTDTDQDGFEKLKTIGKMLDEKIVLEGMSTIVLKTAVSDGQYMFLTQNNGHDTVKSPSGMFPAYAIDNDLKYVDNKIRNYYELGEFLTDEELKADDEAVKHDDVQIKEEKKSRRVRRGKEEEKEPTKAPIEEEKAEEEPEKPRRRRRSITEEKEEARQEALTEIAQNGCNTDDETQSEAVPFEEAETPDVKPLPRRRKRNKEEEPAMNEPQPEEKEEEEPEKPRRRRRRG